MSAAPGCEFPNPCPVCGSTDEHADFRARANGTSCTFCPHPAQPGHGTGCCCAGLSKPLFTYTGGLLNGTSPLPSISSPPLLDPETIRQLLRECVMVVKPGETLILRCPEGWTAAQADHMQEHATRWLEENAPDIRAMVVPHLEMAVVQPESDADLIKRIERVWPHLQRRQMITAMANPSRRPA